jgi:hypothetical protein
MGYAKSNTIVIALMMEAVSTSETSVNFYQTTRHSSQKTASHLHTCHHENLNLTEENKLAHHLLSILYHTKGCEDVNTDNTGNRDNTVTTNNNNMYNNNNNLVALQS